MTTTIYTSMNARPCPDCGQRTCPPRCSSLGLLTSVIPTSPLSDAYVISQDVSTLRDEVQDYITMTGLLEAVGNGPQSHAAGRKAGPRMPVWALVCVFLGLVLIGFSMVGLAVLQQM